MLTVRGASDDLIETDGDIREEFTGAQVNDDTTTHPYAGTYVYLSTGDVLRFRLEAEGWRGHVVVDATGPTMGKVPDSGEDDDLITVAAPVTWVVVCPFAPARAR